MLLHLIHAAATSPAATGTPDVSTFEQYIAPGSGVAVFTALVGYIIKIWRDGRAQDVEGARAKQAEAEKETAALKTDYVAQLAAVRAELEKVRADAASAAERAAHDNESLRADVRRLQDQMQSLRDEQLAELRRRDLVHQHEIATEREHTLKQTKISFRLQQAMASAGVPLPPDLDPERPDVPPRLSLVDDDSDDADSVL